MLALNVGATSRSSKKVPSLCPRSSLYRNPRFYSQLTDDDGSVSQHEFSRIGNMDDEVSQFSSTQMDELDSRFENEDDKIENLEGFEENIVEEKEEEEESEEAVAEKLERVVSVLDNVYDDSLESRLNALEIGFNEAFVAAVLNTQNISPKNRIGFYKWAVKKGKVKISKDVVDAFVFDINGNQEKRKGMDVACALWDLIKEIGEKDSGVLSVENLNSVINCLWKSGYGKGAKEVFDKFGEWGFTADEVTYYNMIGALWSARLYDEASSVCEEMVAKGRLCGAEEVGKVISWLCKGKKGEMAHSVYVMAKEKEMYPTMYSVELLIGLLCQKDETVRLALEMLDDMNGDKRKFAGKQFLAVIRGLCRIKDLNAAKTLLLKMISEGPPPGNAVFNSVINAYSKNGDLKEANQIMKLMEKRGLKPDVYTYTVIMSGYANGGQMKEACVILSEAKKKHSQLHPATYHTLIRGYCKLEEYDKALELFAEMTNFGVTQNVDEYNKMIQSLCLNALDWEKAEKLLEDMKQKGLHLNGITRALIRAVKDLEAEGIGNAEAQIEA